VGDAVPVAREAWFALPLPVPDCTAEPTPELLREDGHDHMAIPRREGLASNMEPYGPASIRDRSKTRTRSKSHMSLGDDLSPASDAAPRGSAQA
jgi:hypothetical protein